MAEMMMTKDRTAIVGFLDILGYGSIVNKMIENIGFIERFDDFMFRITIDSPAKIKNTGPSPIANEPVALEYFKKVVDLVGVRFVFDNIIFSLPLSDTAFQSNEVDDKATTLNCIYAFFALMAMFSTSLIAETGTLLRGGISIGSHYESERDKYLFIFSEAHNKAVKLEREAGQPRILLDDKLRQYLEKIAYPNMEKHFYIDQEERHCFDFYSYLNIIDDPRSVLSDINEAISLDMSNNAEENKKLNEKVSKDELRSADLTEAINENRERLTKLLYFARYHNKKVSKDGLNLADLALNIDEIEKIIEQ